MIGTEVVSWAKLYPLETIRSSLGAGLARTSNSIDGAKQNNPDAPVHVITQLTLSLLGIVVFPYEKFDCAIFAKTIADIEAEGWLGWCVTLDRPKKGKPSTVTLGNLLWRLRNAVAHNGISFDSDVVFKARDEALTSSAPAPSFR